MEHQSNVARKVFSVLIDLISHTKTGQISKAKNSHPTWKLANKTRIFSGLTLIQFRFSCKITSFFVDFELKYKQRVAVVF